MYETMIYLKYIYIFLKYNMLYSLYCYVIVNLEMGTVNDDDKEEDEENIIGMYYNIY